MALGKYKDQYFIKSFLLLLQLRKTPQVTTKKPSINEGEYQQGQKLFYVNFSFNCNDESAYLFCNT